MNIMKPVNQLPPLSQETLNLLMDIDYLVEQMANAHIPLEEGYEKLIQLVRKKGKK